MTTTLTGALADHPALDQWVTFPATGRVTIRTGKVEIGQGAVTTLAQIAAEELDVTIRQLKIISGETWISPSEKFT
ncbi:MAG: molybdopterin-dependent oxidoreductase, partial [Bryobacterales bacterium]|nr:molybdopterin-dependent oxidoreductase [Bryobacterales bacterium]